MNLLAAITGNSSDLLAYVFICFFGIGIGYYIRQYISKKQLGSLEQKLEAKTTQVKEESKKILENAQQKAQELQEKSEQEYRERKHEILKTEQILMKREGLLEKKILDTEEIEKKFHQKIEEVKQIKENLQTLEKESRLRLEEISSLNSEQAKAQLFQKIEQENKQDVLERMLKLDREGREKLERKAKEITALAIQKCALSQAQEMTTTTVSLPNDEIKGRIIGKEGRNIRTFEEMTGVELLVDDTPGAVIISSFDPIRRHVAKLALEKLIHDGRIQPARIEDTVTKAKEEIAEEIKKAGDIAIYETQIIDLDPKLVQIIGRLKFRTSYGQNVLLHSIETCFLAGQLASELGANVKVAKKAGLLHDIGKAVDFQVEGSHVDIGIRILEKFKTEKEVIDAMKAHHGEYKAESLEALLVQAADQISGARPGARKDSLEDYIKRLEDLEKIALSFDGIEKAFAVQAGREIRVFVKPEQVDDIGMYKLAKEISKRIEEELRYPGEIKVCIIREKRVVEYAK